MRINSSIILSSFLTLSIQAGEEVKKNSFVEGLNIDSSIYSKYLAGKAGFIVVDGPVIQTYAGIDTKVGTFHQWSNNGIKEKDWSELDVGWTSKPIEDGKIGVSTFFWGYTYPNAPQRFKKWDLETGFNIFTKNLPVDLNLHGTLNRAGDKYSGMSRISAGKSFDLEDAKLSVNGSVVYGHQYYTNYSDFSHAVLRVEVSRPIVKDVEGYIAFTAQKKLHSFGGKIKDTAAGSVGLRYHKK